ncbi:MAG: transporter substrate-binding domain-containing protein [Phycisphaeraceae bacterium]
MFKRGGAGRGVAVMLSVLLWWPTVAMAQQGGDAERELVVGTRAVPPFAMQNDAGEWSGLAVELWQHIAEEQGYAYRFESRDLAGLFDGLEDGSLDVVAAATTVTAQREARFDFTHPYFTTGLGIAVRTEQRGMLGSLLALLSLELLGVLALLALVLMGVGALAWLFERRRNAAQFRDGPAGLGDGFWWSAVTMTTVGYGDKAPITPGGKLVALVWMFASLILISTFTAAIASALTVTRLESQVQGPEDLPRVRVATVAQSTSALYLDDRRIIHRSYTTAEQALAALVAGEVDAVVYDQPILQYLVLEHAPGRARVLPDTFNRQYYGLGLQLGSDLRGPVNIALLDALASQWWRDRRYRYLGEE